MLAGSRLRLQGLSWGNPQLDGSAAGSKLWLEGSRDLTGIRFATASLAALRMARANAKPFALPIGSDLTITDSIIFTRGIIKTAAQKIIVSTTANFSPESDSSFVLGFVQQDRPVAKNVPTTFSNMRLTITAAGAAPGLTQVLRDNASQADLGGGAKAVACRFTIHTANTTDNLQATLTATLLNTELASQDPSHLIFVRSPTNAIPWSPFSATTRNVPTLTYTLGNIRAFSTWTLGDDRSAVLPVSLSAFRGKTLTAGRNQLNWQTATETNNLGFTLQRSEDGKQYDSVAFVPAQGTGTSILPSYYAYTDNNAPAQAYYRLRQQDRDGRVQTFDPIQLSNALSLRSGELSVYPNPIKDDQFNLIYKGEVKTSCQVRLSSQSGKVLLQRQVMLTPGWEQLVGLPSLPPGIYLLELRLPTGTMLPVRVVRE